MQGDAGASFGWLGWFLFDIMVKSHWEMADVASNVCLVYFFAEVYAHVYNYKILYIYVSHIHIKLYSRFIYICIYIYVFAQICYIKHI